MNDDRTRTIAALAEGWIAAFEMSCSPDQLSADRGDRDLEALQAQARAIHAEHDLFRILDRHYDPRQQRRIHHGAI